MGIGDFIHRRREKWKSLDRLRKEQGVTKVTCPDCGNEYGEDELSSELAICPKCRHYFSLSPAERIGLMMDPGSFKELWGKMEFRNPLDFPDYEEKIREMQEKTGRDEAFTCGIGTIRGVKAAVGVMDASFMMGSMGAVVGEKVARLAEAARKKKLPLIIFCASGGARMQEGMFSLMQMAKTAAEIELFKRSGGLYISCLTNPTTGGVSASFAGLGDIIIAEPKALICFAGPRVIRQTIGQEMPEGFQHAEFLLEHGMIDMILERKSMQKTIYRILKLHGFGKRQGGKAIIRDR